jgi:hypothetical protein
MRDPLTAGIDQVAGRHARQNQVFGARKSPQ